MHEPEPETARLELVRFAVRAAAVMTRAEARVALALRVMKQFAVIERELDEDVRLRTLHGLCRRVIVVGWQNLRSGVDHLLHIRVALRERSASPTFHEVIDVFDTGRRPRDADSFALTHQLWRSLGQVLLERLVTLVRIVLVVLAKEDDGPHGVGHNEVWHIA